mmetsp:Transcript_12200/g.23140  ORF Transcript_12200/g.23140 Transcript_12200/m.23140 type:complete len:341 (-) Transcript_12200:66-1088(-)
METQTLHLLGVACLSLGSFAQQYCFYRKSLQRNSSTTKQAEGVPKIQIVGFVIGIALECFALAILPLSSHIILASLHVFWFHLNLVNDEGRPYFQPELIGIFAILVSLLLAVMAAGFQEQVATTSEYDSLFNGSYFIWMLGSLSFNLVLRKLGFYKGKVLLETCLPAQISAFAYGAAKMLMLSIEVHTSGKDPYIGLLALAVLVLSTSFAINSAFIGQLCLTHDLVVVIGSYYLWLVCYALPLALFVINAGVHYSWLNYGVLTLSSGGACLGVFILTYSRMDHIQQFKKTQLVSLPPTSYKPAPPPARDDVKLNLTMDVENLLEIDNIDEDSLLRSIKDL